MDTTYDMGRLNFEEMLELRELQVKMQDENAAQAWPRHVGAPVEYTRLTLEELLRLEDLHYKMAGEPSPRKPAAPYVCVISSEFTSSSGEAAASASAPTEPVAIAPAPAPARHAGGVPSSLPGPAPAEKAKPPADDVMSAHRQLDALLRFGG